METQKQTTHPSRLHLAALALGKVRPDRKAELQKHLAGCSTCSDYFSNTPRETFVSLFREAQARASEQSTPGIRDAGTLIGIPNSPREEIDLSPPNGPKPAPPGSPQAEALAPQLASEEMPRELREQTKYRVIRLLGRGGMGSVYEAEHEVMRRRVAIKTINPSLVDRPEALKRFDQEVMAAASLDHTNVARAHDADQFGSLRVLVMEFVPGQSLDQLLATRGKLEIYEACRLVRQAMIGLQHAHERKMVHRDLKPQNLMLTPDGKVKILDFGLAKIASERRAGNQGLTRENSLMGTPHYLAPEQARDAAKADIRADIYSLGCTLYCLLTGEPPFNRDTEFNVLLAHQGEKHRPLSEVRPDIPTALSDLVDRMLAKKPEDRPQTPAEAARALAPFVKGPEGVPTLPPEVPPAPPVKTTVEQPSQPAKEPTRRKTHPLEFLKDEFDEAPKSAPRGAAGSSPAAKFPSLRQKPPGGVWLWSGVLAAVFIALAVWGVFALRTQYGTITIKNVPLDGDLFVDGNQVTINRRGHEWRIEAVPRGERSLKITDRAGNELWAKEVSIQVGENVVEASINPNDVAEGNPAPPEAPKWFAPAEAPKWFAPEAPKSAAPEAAPPREPKPPAAGDIPSLGKPAPKDKPLRTFDLMPIIDTSRDAVHGVWKKAGAELTSDGTTIARLKIPYQPPDEYDLRVSFTRKEGGCEVGQILSHDGRQFLFALGTNFNQFGGFAQIDGNFVNSNPTKISSPDMLRNGKRYEVVVHVRNRWIGASVDGMLVAEHETKDFSFSELSLPAGWEIGDGLLGVGSWNNPTTFHKIEIAEISGPGKPLREAPAKTSGGAATVYPSSAVWAQARFPNAENIEGDWKIEADGEELVQTSTETKHTGLAFGDPAWSYYNVTLRAKSDRGANGFCVGWHMQDATEKLHGRVLRLGTDSNSRHDVVTFVGGDPIEDKTNSIPGEIDHSRWYDLRLEVRGPEFTCFLDNNPIFYKRKDPNLTKGRIGLRGYATTYRFKDIKVTSEDGKTVLWEGLPKLPDDKSQASNFVPLFNGKDLTGWKIDRGDASAWSVEEGVIIAHGSIPSNRDYLLTDRQYENFVLRLEYRLDPQASGGVGIRAALDEKLPLGGKTSKIDHPVIKLTDDVKSPSGTTSWIRDRESLPPGKPARSLPRGEWNSLEVTVLGRSLKMTLNGENVLDMTVDSKARFNQGAIPALNRTSGQIGLQKHTGTISYRNIEVKELPATKKERAGATSFGGSQYKVFPEQTTWHGARDECIKLGGHLAIVRSNAENDFLLELVRAANKDSVWLGATDEAKEGAWFWFDGRKMEYANWDSVGKQPDNKQGEEHYLLLWASHDGKWSDQPNISTELSPGYVCQWDD